MKKVLKLFSIILLVILIKLVFSFMINEIVILSYNNNVYNTILIKVLYPLNFNEPYIVYYNEGNILYRKENYEKAIEKYNSAINKKPPMKRICDVRINLSLAIIKNINTTNYQVAYNALEEAKNNLYNDNCASSIDDSGRSKEAEQLEEEINKLLEQLRNSGNSGGSGNNNPNNGDPPPNVGSSIDNTRIEGTRDRNRRQRQREYMREYEYYDGEKW